MNKKIFIIIGAILISLVLGVWLYLFLSGDTAKTDGVFAEFGGGIDSSFTEDTSQTITDVENLQTTPSRLRQLTLRPVAGAVFVGTGIMYVEQGTGHIFHINLSTGNETLMSGTTILKTYSAVFSTNGTYTAITNQVGGENNTLVGSISPDGTLTGVALPPNASEIQFGEEENLLYYLIKEGLGSRGYVYNIEKAEAKELFSIPLRDIRVIWGDDIYVYTTPSTEQTGYIYEVIENKLEYITTGSASLLAFGTPKGPMVTKTNPSYISAQLVKENDGVLFGALLPEKCISRELLVVCAIPQSIEVETFPDSWYKGVVSFSDILWNIDINYGTSERLIDLFAESGREIDVSQIGATSRGDMFYLINKNDNSLWLFDNTL